MVRFERRRNGFKFNVTYLPKEIPDKGSVEFETGYMRPCCTSAFSGVGTRAQRPDCVAGVRGLELANVNSGNSLQGWANSPWITRTFRA
jgi:hypothetical protein